LIRPVHPLFGNLSNNNNNFTIPKLKKTNYRDQDIKDTEEEEGKRRERREEEEGRSEEYLKLIKWLTQRSRSNQDHHLTIQSKIGQGKFCDVYEGEFYNNETPSSSSISVAIKKYRYNNSSSHIPLIILKEMKREIEVLDACHNNISTNHHPQVVENHHPNDSMVSLIHFHFIEGEEPYLVLSLVEDGQTLFDWMNKTNNNKREDISSSHDLDQQHMRLVILYDIARGISNLHSKGFIHGDIKPHNILISSSNNNNNNDQIEEEEEVGSSSSSVIQDKSLTPWFFILILILYLAFIVLVIVERILED